MFDSTDGDLRDFGMHLGGKSGVIAMMALLALVSLLGFDSASAQPAETAQELQDRVSRQMAPIRTLDDWHRYWKAHAKGPSNPLRALSVDARQRFLDALAFGPRGGIMAFDFADVEAEMSLSDAYRLLALFGAQSLVTALPAARVESEDDRLVDTWRRQLPR